ncbi:MAG: acyltransferase family protein [Clostridia bacterium]|jgi:acyltransferase|nr:acyltransferase family protein [Clostridia bacterium]
MEKSKQIEWINILRGFTIFLIVFGHGIGYSKGLTGLSRYLSSFYVPLFFFISGYLFHENKEEKLIPFIKRKAKKILIPYFVFALLSLIPYYLFAGNIQTSLGTEETTSNNIASSLLAVLYGSGHGDTLVQNSPLWFLPCYFLVVVIAKISYEKTRNCKLKSLLLALFFLSIGGIVYFFFNTTYPFGFETALVMLFFYFLGHALKQLPMLSNKLKLIVTITCLSLGFIIHLFNGRISCMNNDYKNSYMIFILSATFSLIGYSYLFSFFKKCNILSYLGKHTIPILVVHKMPLVVFQSKLGIISTYLKTGNIFVQLSLALLMAISSILLSLLAYKIVSKFLPILYGETKN